MLDAFINSIDQIGEPIDIAIKLSMIVIEFAFLLCILYIIGEPKKKNSLFPISFLIDKRKRHEKDSIVSFLMVREELELLKSEYENQIISDEYYSQKKSELINKL